MLFLPFWKRENNVTMCYTQWERKNEGGKQRERTNKTEMRTGWDGDTDEEQEGTVKEKKKKEAKALALSWQFLSHGREDVSSHAPVVRLKNLGLLHSIQQSNSTHGCLVGRELVIPPIPSSACACSFHIPFFPHHKHLHSACFNNPRVSWPPCNKETSSAFLFFLQDTGEHKRHSQQHRRRLRQAKRPRCWKSNAVLSSRIGRSRSAWAIPLVTEVRPQSWGKEMNSDSLMDLINQQVSNGNTQTCVMTKYTR